MSPEQKEAFVNLNDNDRAAKLKEAGVDLSEADKSEMIKFLVEHLATISDDDLMAAAGGEKFIAAAVIGTIGVVGAATITAGATLGSAAIKN